MIMSKHDNYEFLLRLQQAIKAHEPINRKQLAYKIGVSERTLSRWLKGNNCPKQDNIKALAYELNVSMQWLISGEAHAQNAATYAGIKNNPYSQELVKLLNNVSIKHRAFLVQELGALLKQTL